jgi:hypothetical protein
MHGEQVYTTLEFKAYRQQLVTQANSLFNNLGIECYNATGAGILAGIPQISCEKTAIKIVESTRRKPVLGAFHILDEEHQKLHPSFTLSSVYDLDLIINNLSDLSHKIRSQLYHPITVGLAVEKLQNLLIMDRKGVMNCAKEYALDKIKELIDKLNGVIEVENLAGGPSAKD